MVDILDINNCLYWEYILPAVLLIHRVVMVYVLRQCEHSL